MVNSNYSVDEAFAEAAKCTDKGVAGGRLTRFSVIRPGGGLLKMIGA